MSDAITISIIFTVVCLLGFGFIYAILMKITEKTPRELKIERLEAAEKQCDKILERLKGTEKLIEELLKWIDKNEEEYKKLEEELQKRLNENGKIFEEKAIEDAKKYEI